MKATEIDVFAVPLRAVDGPIRPDEPVLGAPIASHGTQSHPIAAKGDTQGRRLAEQVS